MQTFLSKRDEPNVDAGGEKARLAILKMHRRGPQRPDSLMKRAADATGYDSATRKLAMTDAERAARSHADEATEAIRETHALGARLLDPDMSKMIAKRLSADHAPLRKGGDHRWERVHGTWLQVQDLGNGRSRVIGGLAKGLKVPPQSTNASNETNLAQTGATNLWNDEGTANPRPEQVGGFNDRDVSRSPTIVAAAASVPRDAVKAIRQALLPENKRRMMP